MKNFLSFLVSYTKLRIFVALGLRHTSYPLYFKWWWNRPGFLKPNAVDVKKPSAAKTLPESSGTNKD